jgi:hypothetical protein
MMASISVKMAASAQRALRRPAFSNRRQAAK